MAPIVLRGLAAPELDCLAALVLGEADEIAEHAATVTGARFADPGRARLYDIVAGLLRDRPGATLAQRLAAVPEDLVPTISVVLRWSDRLGFEPSIDLFCAARDVLFAEPSAAGAAH